MKWNAARATILAVCLLAVMAPRAASASLPSLLEEKLRLVHLRLNTGGVDDRHGGPRNRKLIDLL